MPRTVRLILRISVVVAATLALGAGAGAQALGQGHGARPAQSAAPTGGSGPTGGTGPSGATGPAASGPLGVSPQPNTPDASPQTQISFLGVAPSALGKVTVVGSRSGRHTGRLLPYSTGQGASFVPSRHFTAGEQVHVHIDANPAGVTTPLDYRFKVAVPAPIPATVNRIAPAGFHLPRQHFVSRPDLFPPPVAVTHDDPSSAPGDIFVAPLTTISASGQKEAQRGPMILDPHGRLVWFHPLHNRTAAENFRAQIYQGAPVLTWWQGRINPLGFGQGEDVIWDTRYHEIARVGGGNGYHPDIHEFVLTPQGTAWVTIYAPVKTDLSSVGGSKNGSILDGVVQEIDVKTGLVMFEWHSLGHIDLKESYATGAKSANWVYTHVNSIQDLGDRVLISARNTWTVYEVSLATGRILFRLGGKHSDFHLGPNAHFAWQHDVTMNPDGTLTVFDNEATPVIHPPSRGIVLSLDTQHKTANLVHQYVHPRRLLAGTQGSVQTLPNGNSFVGWGSEIYFSEFASGGQLVFDAHFPRPIQSYRAYRYPWTSQPPTQPVLSVHRGSGGKLDLYASWNGATEVAAWRILAGPNPGTLNPIATAPRAGFETHMSAQTTLPYVSVVALNASGQTLGAAKPIRV